MNLPDAYTQFFIKSEEGQYFLGQMNALIANNHEKAEDNPESARDFTQRAKGVREVLAHIRVTTTKPKKGGSVK